MATPISVTDYIPLIRLSDLAYPIYMPAVRAANTNTSFPIPIRDDILLPWGYKPVRESEKPPGDVITQGKPELRDDGEYYKTWIARDFTEEEIAQNLADAKQILIDDGINTLGMDIGMGISYNFSGNDYLVSVGQDQMTLLLAIKTIAKDSNDGTEFSYRFQGGELVSMNKEEFLTMLNYIFTVIYTANKNLWVFIEEVNSKNTLQELPELPSTFK